jgi:HAD superfamily hydrolase (TIGR01509 family)
MTNQKKQFSITALIFDFDGLIIDSETADYLSWKETYADFGVELPRAAWDTGIGGVDLFNPYTFLEQQLGRPLDREAVKAVRRQRDDIIMAQMPVMDGVVDYLAEAQQRGLRVAIASSSAHSWVDPLLARLGLTERFEAVLCRDDVGNVGKPDPAVYQAALAALDVQSDTAVALEDSPVGATAALAAGLTTVLVPNPMTRDLSFPPAHYRLNSLADMPLSKLLAKLKSQFGSA